jgi:ABC-type phosphate transport system auxiliary subunit
MTEAETELLDYLRRVVDLDNTYQDGLRAELHELRATIERLQKELYDVRARIHRRFRTCRDRADGWVKQ